jgi:peroxiredoxin
MVRAFSTAAFSFFAFLLAVLVSVVGADEPGASQMFELTELPDRPQGQDFSLLDTEGRTHRLSDYRGKPVILNFCATWCRPCRQEMPALQRAWDALRDQGVVLLAVNMGDREEWIPKFRASFPVDFTFPILLDRKSALAKDWSVKGLPVTFIIDPEGRIVYWAAGEREWDSPAILDKVLALKNE